jgi:hypothetical protein
MTTRLSDERLGELLGLIEDADSVELKLTVPHSDHGTVAGALGLDPLDAEIRQVYFFDTPDLSLSKGGLVVRARRVQGKGDVSVVGSRCDAGRICLLGVDEVDGTCRRPRDGGRSAAAAQAVLEGAAGVLC